MKKNLKIALILSLVCAICAALIAVVNLVTKDVINNNKIAKQEKALNELYDGATFNEVVISDFKNINKIFEVYKDDTLIGYIYDVEGKNSYGLIELMIGINLDKSIQDVVVFKNTQSYKQIVDKHIQDEYVTGVSQDDIDNIDVYCGATKGAKLTKDLVKIAFAHFDKNFNKGVSDNND